MSYESAVAECRELVKGIKTNRLKIAEISLRPEVIKIGKTELTFDAKSASKFAKDIGVTASTLLAWQGAYRKYREKHPRKEPKVEDFKPAVKAFKERPDVERPRAAPIETRKAKDLLRSIESMRRFIRSDVGCVSRIDAGVRRETIIKLREILSVLEGSLK